MTSSSTAKNMIYSSWKRDKVGWDTYRTERNLTIAINIQSKAAYCRLTTSIRTHYNDVIIMASQITSISIVCTAVCSEAHYNKQSCGILDFLSGIHRWPVDSPHKKPVTREIFWRRHHPMMGISFKWQHLRLNLIVVVSISITFNGNFVVISLSLKGIPYCRIFVIWCLLTKSIPRNTWFGMLIWFQID